MGSWDYTEWYERLPLWAAVVLFPLLLAVMLVHLTVAMAFLLLFVLPFFFPYFIITGAWESHRFWKRLRQSGRVTSWLKVESLLATEVGTLVVEIGPKGPGIAWWIAHARSEIDPERVVPSWQGYEERGWDVFEPTEEYERQERWATDHLGAFEPTARALAPSWAQLTGLSPQTKCEGVVVLVSWTKGSLSGRCT